MKIWEGSAVAKGLRFGIIVSRWNECVTTPLLEGALEVLRRQGADHIEIMKIPGCFEMPIAAKRMAERGSFDALICLGAVIRGETTHHKHIARAASQGISRVSQEFNIPIGFGILTTETIEQATQRAGQKTDSSNKKGSGAGIQNKGAQAALAAIEMVTVFRNFNEGHRRNDGAEAKIKGDAASAFISGRIEY